MTPNISLLVFTLLLVAVVGLSELYNGRTVEPALDRCQAKFENSPSGRGYNWPAFHQENSIAKLNCRDVSASLRVCDVVVPSVDPISGLPGASIHEPFACNATECGWLTE